jgi:hypothetical protein
MRDVVASLEALSRMGSAVSRGPNNTKVDVQRTFVVEAGDVYVERLGGSSFDATN